MLWDPPGCLALDPFMFSQVEICHAFTCAVNCKSDGFVQGGGGGEATVGKSVSFIK